MTTTKRFPTPLVPLSCRNSSAQAPFIFSRSKGEDIVRSPSTTAADAVSGVLMSLEAGVCRAVEAPTMSRSLSSSRIQTVTDSTLNVSEMNFAASAHRSA